MKLLSAGAKDPRARRRSLYAPHAIDGVGGGTGWVGSGRREFYRATQLLLADWEVAAVATRAYFNTVAETVYDCRQMRNAFIAYTTRPLTDSRTARRIRHPQLMHAVPISS